MLRTRCDECRRVRINYTMSMSDRVAIRAENRKVFLGVVVPIEVFVMNGQNLWMLRVPADCTGVAHPPSAGHRSADIAASFANRTMIEECRSAALSATKTSLVPSLLHNYKVLTTSFTFALTRLFGIAQSERSVGASGRAVQLRPNSGENNGTGRAWFFFENLIYAFVVLPLARVRAVTSWPRILGRDREFTPTSLACFLYDVGHTLNNTIYMGVMQRA